MQEREKQFEKIFRTEYTRMYRAAYILLGDEDEAKDAVQDVFTHLWDKTETLREESLRLFLMTCIRNRCLNIIAHKQKQLETATKLAVANTPEATTAWNEKSDDELTDMVQSYIDERLTPQTGRIIRMRYNDDKSYKEISNKLGISLSAVNKHIVQGMRKLRQHFKA